MGGSEETYCLEHESLQLRRLSRGWSRVGFIKQFLRLKEKSCQVFSSFSGLARILRRPQTVVLPSCLEAEVKDIFICQEDSLGKNIALLFSGMQ